MKKTKSKKRSLGFTKKFELKGISLINSEQASLLDLCCPLVLFHNQHGALIKITI